jgi:hypothetical protein
MERVMPTNPYDNEEWLRVMRVRSRYLALAFCTVATRISSYAQNLRGYVDLHTHPMSYLGFGGKAVHGVPDIGGLIPAGTRDCNPNALRAASIEQALGDCKSTHGGWGTDNTCGDYIREAIIDRALDSNLSNHQPAGYPNFYFWPNHNSILHQQMWWELIKRSDDGGLKVEEPDC